MEDYKKKYEQALDNFKKIKAANKDNKELVDFIEYKYPELKESEDEKIRKSIIRLIQRGGYMSPEDKDKAYAWLEKQNKQNPIWSEKEKARIDRIINVLDWAEEKGRISYSDWEDYVTYVKSLKPQSSQKPVWSEEDEEMFDAIIADIQFTQKAHTHDANQVVYEREIDWLKSLKERMKGE